MTDKQINKWLRRQFTVIGWVLIGYYVLVNGLAMVAMAWEALRQLRGLIGQGQAWWTQIDVNALAGNAWGYIVSIAVLFCILHGWKGPGYWRDTVLVKESTMGPGVFFSMLCLCMGCQMINTFWVTGLEMLVNCFDKSLMPMLESVSGDSDTFSMFLYVSILAPIAEELLFRGYILRSLRPYGKKFAVFGSAFLFGLFHGNLLQTPYAFLMGLLMGYVTVEYSVFWAIGVHMFNNLVLADLLTRLTKPLPEEIAGAISMIILGIGLAASGVILAVKCREIRAYLSGECMDRRVLKCFFTCGGMIVLMVMMFVSILLFLP